MAVVNSLRSKLANIKVEGFFWPEVENLASGCINIFPSFMSDATNDFVNNLPSEEDVDSIKLQKLDDASVVQLTTIVDQQKRKRKQRVL